MQVTFHGQPMSLVGLPLKIGDRARDVRVSDADLSPVLPLERSHGKVRLFITVPSLDTAVCACETRRFRDDLKAMESQLGSLVEVFLISADLPFAQTRWKIAEGIETITFLSDYRDMDFARDWGLLIKDLGLLARAVFVINHDAIVTYREVVPELTAEPNYEAAIAAVQAAILCNTVRL